MVNMDKMDDNIEDDSLTTENLLYILIAMKRINPNQQTQCYIEYMGEIMQRLKENESKSKAWIETQLSKAMAQRNQEPGNQ
jgi:hypothetical protein